MTAAHVAPWRVAVACLVAATVAGLGAGEALAGSGVRPNAEAISVVASAAGAITSPAAIDLVVRLDPGDVEPHVWVSESPAPGADALPAAGTEVGSCGEAQLTAVGESGEVACRTSTASLVPGRTYYWWLVYRRADTRDPAAAAEVSGPFAFTLVQRAAAAPPPAPAPARRTATAASTKTATSAATLRSSGAWDGARSIKHTGLTSLVYGLMKQLGRPKTLAVACWNEADWLSVVKAEGDSPSRGGTTLRGFWKPSQPRWLHLAPFVCDDVQALMDSTVPTGQRAAAVSTVIHESLHAHGIDNEAQTNCFAVQLVPFAGGLLKLGEQRANYLGTLALRYVRSHAPAGYWSGRSCRDGGRWDIIASQVNLR
ncbi:MAG TPA: hypothetical protein VH950_14790 [Gaiellaceae bacterium]